MLAVNIFDYLSFRALAVSFAAAKRPVIAQCSARLFKQYAPEEVVAWRTGLGLGGVWLHLDHCDDFALLARCAEAGFDAVMFDGSHHPLAENIRRSAKAVAVAKDAAPSVLVECEIGHVPGVEDGFGADVSSRMPRLDDVLEFHRRVKPDLLAVGFGNMHGHYRGDETFDLELVREVGRVLPRVPLVLHGGSGLELHLVRRLVRWGHCKLNISTDLKQFWMRLLKDDIPHRANLDSPLAVASYQQEELNRFFSALQKKYRLCLL